MKAAPHLHLGLSLALFLCSPSLAAHISIHFTGEVEDGGLLQGWMVIDPRTSVELSEPGGVGHEFQVTDGFIDVNSLTQGDHSLWHGDFGLTRVVQWDFDDVEIPDVHRIDWSQPNNPEGPVLGFRVELEHSEFPDGATGVFDDGYFYLPNAEHRSSFFLATGELRITTIEIWPPDLRPCGDLNLDGDTDSHDRTILTQNWTGALQPGGSKLPE